MPVVIVIAALLVAPTALAVSATYLYTVPYIGLATAYVPWYLSWLTVAAVTGSVLALIYWRRRRSRVGAVLAVLAALTIAGASVIDARMIVAVEHAGADISLIDTFGVGVPKHAASDEEVIYRTFEGERLRLSIFRPHETSSHAPVLVYIHGGGWVAGDLTARSTDLRWFAEQGWLVVSVDYTLSSAGRHLWDVTQDQIGCALGWVVATSTSNSSPSRTPTTSPMGGAAASASRRIGS